SACGGATRSANAVAEAPAIIHSYAPPRPARDLDHAVVYRREDEFCAWTYTRGFWEDASGHLMQNFDALTVDYRDPDFINHNNVFRNARGRKQVTVRSTDRGLTWNGEDPEVDLLAAIPGAKAFAGPGPSTTWTAMCCCIPSARVSARRPGARRCRYQRTAAAPGRRPP